MPGKESPSLLRGITGQLNELAEKIKGKLPGDLVKDVAESLPALTRDTGQLAAAEAITAARAVVKVQRKVTEQTLKLLDTALRAPDKLTERLAAEKSALPPEAKAVLRNWSDLLRNTRQNFKTTLLDSFDQALKGLDRTEKELKSRKSGPATKPSAKKAAPAKAKVSDNAGGKNKPAATSKKSSATTAKKSTKPTASPKKKISQDTKGESANS
ncbi:MAG TPA: hypothetical protein PLX03_07570 [Candidatus Hydrogenedentes bacterium]|nr:hypothetical protein [Candidatus Hydrogenedentota bacterium]